MAGGFEVYFKGPADAITREVFQYRSYADAVGSLSPRNFWSKQPEAFAILDCGYPCDYPSIAIDNLDYSLEQGFVERFP